ncbi:MAG TPA: hypothetical protein VNU21_17155 [Usitatibacter sp.]|jgi:hypothetical protein|nr:hypothetical protein [Usitatibacter sp.]
MKRRLRPFASVLAIVALLFAQVMMSVHACDMEAGRPAAPAASTAAAGTPDGGDCCVPKNTVRDPACENHCTHAATSVDRTDAVTALEPAAATVVAPPLAPRALAPPAPLLVPDLARHTQPPIPLRHCCFRI